MEGIVISILDQNLFNARISAQMPSKGKARQMKKICNYCLFRYTLWTLHRCLLLRIKHIQISLVAFGGKVGLRKTVNLYFSVYRKAAALANSKLLVNLILIVDLFSQVIRIIPVQKKKKKLTVVTVLNNVGMTFK